MPDPDYDKLMQIEDWTTNEQSPFYKQLMQALEPYNQKMQTKAQSLIKGQGGKQLSAKQKSDLFKEYQQVGAAKTLELLQGNFGGKIPDQKEAQEFDYARRVKQLMGSPDFKGTQDDAYATVRQGDAPYSRAYGIVNSLQAMLPKDQPAAAAAATPAPGQGGQAALELTSKLGPDASDDEKLSEAQLMMLYKLAHTANSPTQEPLRIKLGTPTDASPDVQDEESPVDKKLGENLRRLMEYGR